MAVEKIFRIKIDGKDEFVDLDKYISDAEESGKGLKTQLREINQALGQLDETSDEFLKASAKAGELKDRIGDINQTVNALASDTFQLDGFIGVANGITSAFAGTAVAMDIFGIQNERLNKVMEKTQQLLVLLNSLQSIQQLLQRQSTANIFLNNVAQGINNSLKITDNIQTAINTGLKSTNVIVTGAATVAQRALNAAMAANPMFLLISAVAALTAGYMLLGDETDDNTKSQEEYNKALEQKAKLNQAELDYVIKRTQLDSEKAKNDIEEAKNLEDKIQKTKEYYAELNLAMNLEIIKLDEQKNLIDKKLDSERAYLNQLKSSGGALKDIADTENRIAELTIQKKQLNVDILLIAEKQSQLDKEKEKATKDLQEKEIERLKKVRENNFNAFKKEIEERKALLESRAKTLELEGIEKAAIDVKRTALKQYIDQLQKLYKLQNSEGGETITRAEATAINNANNALLEFEQSLIKVEKKKKSLKEIPLVETGLEEAFKKEYKRLQDEADALEKAKQARIDYINAVQETVNQSIMLINQFTQIAIDSQNARLENQISNVEEMKAMIQIEIDNVNTLIQDSANRQLEIENALKNARGLRREALLNDLAIEKKAQEKAEKERVKLENDKLKKDEEIARKRQQIEKNNAIGVLVSSSAQAALAVGTIAAQAAKKDFTFGVATVAAIGAVLASVTSAIVAAKNLSKFEKGGIIDGPSHAEGGVKIMGGTAEVEGGELIVNKNIWSRPGFVRAISEMNAQTGGKRFYAQGGILEPNFSNINSSLQSNEISMLRADILALSNRPIYTSITDINNANSRINKINDSVLI